MISNNTQVGVPVKKDIPRYYLVIRLWHWVNAILMMVSLLIVLVNLTILKPENNVQDVWSKLKFRNAKWSIQETLSLARFFSDKLWVVHAYIGLGIALLVLLRIVIEFFLPKERRLTYKIKGKFTTYKLSRHDKLVKMLYAVFYLLLLVMTVTGMSVVYQNELSFLKGNTTLIADILTIHHYTMYPIITFIIVHIGGVIIAEKRKRPGIVSEMINGGKENSN